MQADSLKNIRIRRLKLFKAVFVWQRYCLNSAFNSDCSFYLDSIKQSPLQKCSGVSPSALTIRHQGCRDFWSVCTFQSGFSFLSMYACSMLLYTWCLGVLCTGYPPLGARQPTESWRCVYLCGSQHSRTQHRFVPLSMHCRYASVIEPIFVCIAIMCFENSICDQRSKVMNSHVLQLPLQRVCCCMALAGSLGVHTPHKEVDNSLLISLQCHHHASSDIILCLPFVWRLPSVIV